MSAMETALVVGAALYFICLTLWASTEVYRLSEPIRFTLRALFFTMTVVAVLIGLISAAVHWSK
jgi:hypothetical protein